MAELNEIRRRLAVLRGKIATALFVDGTARLAVVLLIAIGLSFALDRVLKLEVAARGILLVAALSALAWVAWRVLYRRLRRLPGEDPLAVAVEARFPELNDRLISALQLARETEPERYGMSPALIEDAIAEALEPAAKVRFAAAMAHGRLFRTALIGAFCLLVLAAGAVADTESASIWFRRNVLLQEVRWPQKTYLVVDTERFPDGVARLVRGQDFVVTARSVGEVHPDRVRIYFVDSEGEKGRATMKADMTSRVYRHEFKEITYPLSFHLEGGDEVTDEYRIELMDPPGVSELAVSVGFPPYAGREPVSVDLAMGDPEMLRGGFVVVEGLSTKPLEAAHVVLGDAKNGGVEAELEGEKRFSARFAPEETVLAGIRLRDTDGLSNPSLAPRFLVRVLEDRAPRVRLQKVGIGNLIVTGAVFPYRVRAHDDVKLTAGRLEVRRAAGDGPAPEPTLVPLPSEQLGVPSAEIEGELEIGTLDVEPGVFLTFGAFASDNAQPEPHEGQSDLLTVKVVTLEELFRDLLRRQQEQRQLFEELIQKERRLRDRFRDLRDSPPTDPNETRLSIESESQEQRGIGRRVRTIARAMTQILDEMLHNRVYEPSRVDELRRKVVRAMQRLHEEVIEGHAQDLDDHARRADRIDLAGDDGAAIDDGYGRVLQAMEAVLAHMRKVEGFTEIVERMRGILDLHKGVSEATRKKYEAYLREIFGGPPGGGESPDGE